MVESLEQKRERLAATDDLIAKSQHVIDLREVLEPDAPMLIEWHKDQEALIAVRDKLKKEIGALCG